MPNATIVTRFFRRIRANFFRSRYLVQARQVVDTQPAVKGDMDFILLSMVHQRDVYSYLVAAKSFMRFNNPKRVVVVCDPSIQEADRVILLQHIPHAELRHADEFTHANIPRGGTWERLFAISGYAAESYVVQLDADTLTLQPNAEVKQAIVSRRGFVLGEMSDQKLLSLTETSAIGREGLLKSKHIQIASEAVIAELWFEEQARYVRGCAGFTGFPPDPSMREKLIRFSTVMGEHFGVRWKEWGTEQVASNFLVANCPATTVLPFPKYGTPDVERSDTAFLHFIGPMRFINSRYQKLTAQALACFSSGTP